MIHNHKSRLLPFTFVKSGMAAISYMISVKPYRNAVRKTALTNLFNDGETEAVVSVSVKTRDRAGTGTQGRPWLDKDLSNIQ